MICWTGTSGTSSAITRGYTYDANSNQLSTTGTVAITDSIASTSNQLNSTTGGITRTYSYDAAGNTTGYASNAYTFNQRGRIAKVLVGPNETDYVYNALGQLIRKSGYGGTTLLVYDEAGHTLGEYTASGALVQETIWMGDTPIAMLQPDPVSGVDIYYVHTDHLGTPRKVTRPSDNGLMWRWDPDTFGSVTPNTNPAGLGAFNYNLRFPGQYALNESGVFYNYFRDYDPATGRYIESDPLGLGAGINTYAYAAGNPLTYFDPFGLDIMVITGGMKESTNPLGHVGTAIQGYGMASYGNNTPLGSSVLDYLNSQGEMRDQQVTIIPTSPMQDLLAQAFVKKHPGMNSVTKVDNCAVRTNQLLDAARIPMEGNMFPGGVAREVASLPGATTYFIPKNGPIPPALLNVLKSYSPPNP
jgi:RHS repeat-associated protein